MEQERALPRAGLGLLDGGDEEGVVAGGVLLLDAASEPGGGVGELGRAGRVGVAQRDPLPERDRRDAAGEMLGQVLLAGGEDADRELLRLAQQLVQRGVAADREADERRIERERDERGDGQPDATGRRSRR